MRTPDTAVNLPFAGVSAQRTTMQMGNAVHNACNKLKQELFSTSRASEGRQSRRVAIDSRDGSAGAKQVFPSLKSFG